MPKKIEWISQREFARRLNVDEKAVRKAIADKKLTESDGYNPVTKKINYQKAKLNPWAQVASIVKPQRGVSREKAIEKHEKGNTATESIKKNTKSADAPEQSVMIEEGLLETIIITKSTDIKEAMRLREVLGAAMDKLKLEEQKRLLVPKNEVEKLLFEYGNEIKKALITIPERVTADMRAAPTDIDAMNILKQDITQLLTMLSKGQSILN